MSPKRSPKAIPKDYDRNPDRFRLARSVQLELPDRDAVRDYLVGKGVTPDRAGLGADSIEAPLLVTKRGALLFARKR